METSDLLTHSIRKRAISCCPKAFCLKGRAGTVVFRFVRSLNSWLRIVFTFLLLYCSEFSLGGNPVAEIIEGAGWSCNGFIRWSNPMESTINNLKSHQVIKFPWWNCSEDTNCEYGQYYEKGTCTFLEDLINPDKPIMDTCIETYPDFETFDMKNRIFGPFKEFDTYCNTSLYACDKGYYETSVECKSCLTGINVDCGKGFYMKRCVQELDLKTVTTCDECMYPVLPSIAYRYSYGSLFEDCENYIDSFEEFPLIIDDTLILRLKKCAWFLTPKWELGYCPLECTDGYVAVQNAMANNDPFFIPECKLCPTNCSVIPGKVSPVCLGGRQPNIEMDSHNGECLDCPAALPANAHWLSDCQWTCNAGFFWNHDVLRCSECPIRRTCNLPNEYFMGCNNGSIGSCTYCSIMGCDVGKYISYNSSLPQCKCVNCKTPILGITYIIHECFPANSTDTLLGLCSSSCALGYYISKNCSLTENIQCRKCTIPIPGRLLKRPCSLYADAEYMDCPMNKSCDGSTSIMDCPVDRRPLNGLCVCPLYMQHVSTGKDICVAIECGEGQYMDLKTGMCKSCYYGNSSYDDVNLTEVYIAHPGGSTLDSCFCAHGYFRRVSSVGIRCWPCGNLNCPASEYQKQSKCNGLTAEEPSCECMKLPGLSTILNATTSISCIPNVGDIGKGIGCSDGYQSSSSVMDWVMNENEKPNERYSFGFLSISNSDQFIWGSRQSHGNERVDKIVRINEEYALLLYSTNNYDDVSTSRYVSLLHTTNSDKNKGMKVEEMIFDSEILRQSKLEETVQSTPFITDIMLHSRKDENMYVSREAMSQRIGMVWIAFSCLGICSDDGLEHENTKSRECSFLELLEFQTQNGNEQDNSYCMLGVCIYPAINFWGNHFPNNGISRSIYSMALGRWEEENDYFMYLALGSSNNYYERKGVAIGKYPLLFNHDPFLAVNKDYMDAVEIIFEIEEENKMNHSILDVASGVGGIYAILSVDPNVGKRMIFQRNKRLYYGIFISLDTEYKAILWNETTPPIISTNELEYFLSDFDHNYDDGYVYCGFLSLSYHLLSIQFFSSGEEASVFLTIDLWNRIVSNEPPSMNLRQFMYSTQVVDGSHSVSKNVGEKGVSIIGISIMKNGSMNVVKAGTYILCIPDYVHYYNDYSLETQMCTMLHCLRKESCGIHSDRIIGTHSCICNEGYEYKTSKSFAFNLLHTERFSRCEICPVTLSENVYCEGGVSAKKSCPLNSLVVEVVNSNKAPSSVLDCYCKPGYYLPSMNSLDPTINLPSVICLPCLRGTWCPYNGTLIPLQCHGGGTTEYGEQTTPKSCFCPSRTHGIGCIPCSDHEICGIEDSGDSLFVDLMYMSFLGIGSVNSPNIFKFCLLQMHGIEMTTNSTTGMQIFNSLHYNIDLYSQYFTLYIISKGYSTSFDRYIEQSVDLHGDNSLLFFNIFIISEKPQGSLDGGADSIQYLSSCVSNFNDSSFLRFNITGSSLLDLKFNPTKLRINKDCGELNGQPYFWEWNGLLGEEESCVCIAGYEPIFVDRFIGSSLKCFPCLNGTFRSRRSMFVSCIPCENPEHEYAPYIGMSSCICRPGFVLRSDQQLCEPIENYKTSLALLGFAQETPVWYQDLSPPIHAIAIVGCIGVLFIIILLAIVYFLF